MQEQDITIHPGGTPVPTGPAGRRRYKRLYRALRWAAAGGAAIVLVKSCIPIFPPPPLIDREGRVVIYHGVNVANSAKHTPGHCPWQSRYDFEKLPNWGFNLVRYLVFWDGVEPHRGEYDDSYLDRVLEHVRVLHDLDIDVLLDFHQDLYNPRFGGNGFPDWTVDTGGHTFHRRKPWQMNYLEPAVQACYSHFWQSPELKQQYIAMIEHVLDRVDTSPNVIGIEIMNEPWPDELLTFEPSTLTHFYEDVLAMKRRRGFRCRLFFEPVIYTSAGLRSRLRFFPGTTANDDTDCVYAAHYYDPFCHEGKPYLPLIGPFLMRCSVRGKVKDAHRFETPLMFTEFGISPKVKKMERFLTDWLRWMDRYGISWTYWSYDRSDSGGFALVDREGRPRTNLDAIIQLYAQRIAGRDIRIRRTHSSFQLDYTPSPAVTAPTIIFIPPKLHVTNVTINGESRLFPSGAMRLEHRNGNAQDRQSIRIEWQARK